MTPFEIELLIHYYCSASPFPRNDAPIMEDTIKWFLENDLIEFYGKEKDCYRTTDKGEAHIIQLCSLDLPERAWVGSNGKVIEKQ